MRIGWLCGLVACGAGQVADTGSRTPLAAALADAGPDLAGPVGVGLQFDGTGSVGASFAWDFGDGTATDGVAAEHTYVEPGVYTAVLSVRGEDGALRTDTAVVVAHRPIAEPGPSHSGGIPWAADRWWVVVPEAGTLVGVAADDRVEIEVCVEPRQVALSDEGLWVVCGEDTWVRVDPIEEAVVEVGSLVRGCHPRGVVAKGAEVRVACSGTGELRDPVQALTVGEIPDVRGMVWAESLIAASFRGPDGVASVGSTPVEIAPSLGPDTDTETRGVITRVEQLLLDPSATVLYLSAMVANTERGLWRDGLPLTFETTIRAVVDAYDVDSGERLWRKQFDDHGFAGPMALSPLGERLYVAGPANQDVTVLDAYDGDIVSSVLNAGQGIRGLSVHGDQLVVHAWLDRQVRAFHVDDLTAVQWEQATVQTEPLLPEVLLGKQVFWDATDPRMSKAGYLACVACHPDGEDDGLTWDFSDRGEGLRNTTSLRGGGNPDSGPLHWTGNFDEFQDFESDARLHFGGEGFLTEEQWTSGTTSDSLGDPKAGMSEELDALDAYLSSLTAWPVPPGESSPEDLALLTDLGCTVCHTGVAYTDSATGVRHDVGTFGPGSGQRRGGELDGLDTPTLRGVWKTSPWLHDGSAETLEEAIERHNPGLNSEDVQASADVVSKL